MVGKSHIVGKITLEKIMINFVPIERAATLIHNMLPDTAAGWRKAIFSPDYIIERAMELEATISNVRIPRWEQREDEELVAILLGKEPEFVGDLLVVTDVCLGGSPPGAPDVDGAFFVEKGAMLQFVAAYRQQITSHFIDGDVLIFSPDEGRIAVFDHEGMVTHIWLKSSTHGAE